jgi:hypothetical protein
MAAGALALFVLMAAPAATAATDSNNGWSPRSSERLMKLPPNYLKKAIDQDYARSPLAAAIGDAREAIRLKVQTLEDLRAAADRADGDLKLELQHQLLGEKRAYLELISGQQQLRKKRARAMIRLSERMLGNIKRRHGAMTPRRAALIQKQTDAVSRFEASLDKVNTKLFRTAIVSESKYAREYAKNVGAIEQLVQAIGAHPMNPQGDLDGKSLTREELVRRMIAENESEIAVLDQEQSILGYMAKLVALDAMALSDAVAGDDPELRLAQDNDAGLSEAVNLFVSR